MVICFVYYCYTATYLIVDNVCSAVPKSRYKNNIAVLNSIIIYYVNLICNVYFYIYIWIIINNYRAKEIFFLIFIYIKWNKYIININIKLVREKKLLVFCLMKVKEIDFVTNLHYLLFFNANLSII